MKIRKLTAAALAVMSAAYMLTGCGNSDSISSKAPESRADSIAESSADSKPAESAADTSEPEKQPETDEEWHQAMLKKSLVTVGDTAPIKKKTEKARSGEKVTVAYLGGSITEGVGAGDDLCYAKLSYEKFKERFGKDGGENVEYVNAGISGTPSRLGNLRLQRDVLSHSPDICFIEFAVNDSMDEDCQAAYESIVRDLIEHDCAPVLLFSVTAADYSAQDYMKKIGEYYGLPMISYCDALRYMFENNRMTWKDFSSDQSHPNKKGHALVAEMIDHYFEKAAGTDTEAHAYPDSPLSIMIQQGMTMLENDAIEPVSLGSWKKGSAVQHFQNGWTYDPDGDNEPLIFKFKGKFAHLVYKEVKSGAFGDLHIKITCDGEPYDEKTVKTVTNNGFGNPQITLLGMQASEKEYTVEISMEKGSEDQNGEILAIAHN